MVEAETPATWSGVRRDTFVFLSPSNDLRFLGATPLRPSDLAGGRPRGTAVDYVDPRLRMTFLSYRRIRQVTMRFRVEESFVPGLDSRMPRTGIS